MTEPTNVPKAVSVQEAQAVMEGEKRRRVEVCAAAITAALEANGCALVPILEIRGGTIVHRLSVESL